MSRFSSTLCGWKHIDVNKESEYYLHAGYTKILNDFDIRRPGSLAEHFGAWGLVLKPKAVKHPMQMNLSILEGNSVGSGHAFVLKA